MKTVLSLAAGVIALLLVWAAHMSRESSQARREIARLAVQRNAFHAQANTLAARTKSATAGRATFAEGQVFANAINDRGATAPAKGTYDLTAPRIGTTPAAAPRRMSPYTILGNSPEKTAEYLRHIRDSVDWKYGSAFKAIGLTPAQIEKFKDVEAELEVARIDLQAAIDSQGIDSGSAEYKRLLEEYYNSRAPRKAEALGELADMYVDYYRTNDVRGYAQQLAWTGIYTGERVTAEQVERVADVLIANSPRVARAGASGWADWKAIDWINAKAQLRDLLSHNQIEMLGALVECDKAQIRVDQRTRELTAQFKSQPPTK